VLAILSLNSLALPLLPAAGGPPTIVVLGAVVAGALGLVAAVGLWLRRRWATWLGVILSALNALGAVPGIVVAPTLLLQVSAVTAIVGAVLIVVLVLLPASRRAYA
jgi:uncharacterized membrane protein (DUF2068 family)